MIRTMKRTKVERKAFIVTLIIGEIQSQELDEGQNFKALGSVQQKHFPRATTY
jgi:hypothetical protein